MIDPKPQLSKAAILANIGYYHAEKRKAIEYCKLNRFHEKYWQRELEKLNALSHNNK
jgi:hypothetical protein